MQLSPTYHAYPLQTSGSLSWFVLAMVLYPEVQVKAQEEIDLKVGSDRLPTFSDFERLPYIHAVVKESLRWHPAVPLGLSTSLRSHSFASLPI